MFSGPQWRGKARNLCQEVNLFPVVHRVEQKKWRCVLKLADWAVHWVVTFLGCTLSGNFLTGDFYFAQPWCSIVGNVNDTH